MPSNSPPPPHLACAVTTVPWSRRRHPHVAEGSPRQKIRETRAKHGDEEKPSSSSHASPLLEEFCASPSFIHVLSPLLQGSVITADVAERRRATTTRSYRREEELYSTLLSPSIHGHHREGFVAVVPVPSFVPFVAITLPETLPPWILPLRSLGTNFRATLNNSDAAT